MVSSLLAFRPSRVAERLGPRSHACPITARELVGPAIRLGLVVPVVRAPLVAVGRAALVAAASLESAIGLVLPAGVPVEPWFGAVARAADELGAWVPVVLGGEVAAGAWGAIDAAWRLVDAGVTHLAIDATALDDAARPAAVAELAAPAVERGLGWEVVVALAEAGGRGARAAALVRALAERGAPPDLLGVTCPAAEGDEAARAQAAALAALSAATGGLPVARRGPVSPALLELLRGSPVVFCDDGGAAAARALAGLAPAEDGEGPAHRARALERAAAALSRDETDRLEALAYVEASDLVERLGGAGSTGAFAAALGAARSAR